MFKIALLLLLALGSLFGPGGEKKFGFESKVAVE